MYRSLIEALYTLNSPPVVSFKAKPLNPGTNKKSLGRRRRHFSGLVSLCKILQKNI